MATLQGYSIKSFKASLETVTLDELSKVTVRSVSKTDRTVESDKGDTLHSVLVNFNVIRSEDEGRAKRFIKTLVNEGFETVPFELLNALNKKDKLPDEISMFEEFKGLFLSGISVLVKDVNSIEPMDKVIGSFYLNKDGYISFQVKKVIKLSISKINWDDDTDVEIVKPTTTASIPVTPPSREINF